MTGNNSIRTKLAKTWLKSIKTRPNKSIVHFVMGLRDYFVYMNSHIGSICKLINSAV